MKKYQWFKKHVTRLQIVYNYLGIWNAFAYTTSSLSHIIQRRFVFGLPIHLYDLVREKK